MRDEADENEQDRDGASGRGWTPRTRLAAFAVTAIAIVLVGSIAFNAYQAAMESPRRFRANAEALLAAIERSDPPAIVVHLAREELGTTLPEGARTAPLSPELLAGVRRSIDARRNLLCCEVLDPGEVVLVLVPFANGEPVRYAQQFVTTDGRLTIGKDTVDFLGDGGPRRATGE